MDILFIQTGGTIDKDYPRVTKGYAFEIAEPAIKRMLVRVNPTFTFEINPLLQKDSQEITDDDRQTIRRACQGASQRHIVVTHGTDTMIETGLQLAEIKDKVIVITGSMRPEKFTDSDADFNAGMAVGALASLRPGIYIAMHGQVMPVRDCTRNLETGQFIRKQATKATSNIHQLADKYDGMLGRG